MKTVKLDGITNIRNFWNLIEFQENNLISIIGRVASGKTLVSVALACLAYEIHNKKVLLIGSDGTAEEYLRRFERFSSQYKKSIDCRSERDCVVIQVTNERMTIEEIKEYMDNYSPDIVVIDSLAVYRGFDDVDDFAASIAQLAKSERKNIIVTSQSGISSDNLSGNPLSFVSDVVLVCRDKSYPHRIYAEVVKSRRAIHNVFEVEFNG